MEKVPAPGHDLSMFKDKSYIRLLEMHNTWTLFFDEILLGCAGTITLWPGRSNGWTIMSLDCAPHMTAITRLTQGVLNEVKGRIEMTVLRDFKTGQRWAEMLGFKIENPPGILRAYGPSGEDHIAYVRFNR